MPIFWIILSAFIALGILDASRTYRRWARTGRKVHPRALSQPSSIFEFGVMVLILAVVLLFASPLTPAKIAAIVLGAMLGVARVVIASSVRQEERLST